MSERVFRHVSTVTAPSLRQQFWRPLVLILEDDVWLEDRCGCELGGNSLNATQNYTKLHKHPSAALVLYLRMISS